MAKNRKPNVKQSAKVQTHLKAEILDSNKLIPVVRTKDDDTVSMFSDGLLVQNRDEMFTLSFLQTQYPLVASMEEASQVETLEQRCLYQIIVSPIQMAKNIKAMSDNFKRYVSQLPVEIQQSLNQLAGFISENEEADYNNENATTNNR